MKIKKIIYTSIIIILLVYLNQQYIYCFETNQKIIFRSSVEIGPKGQSYTLPDRKGYPGETLQMGYDNKMRWAGFAEFNPVTTPFAITEPFLKTRDRCPSDTMFLPIRPRDYLGEVVEPPEDNMSTGDMSTPEGDMSTVLGYCIVTDNGKWRMDENGNGILSDWVAEPESPFYCLEKYQAYNTPDTFTWPRLFPVMNDEQTDDHDSHTFNFSLADQIAINDFFHAVKLQLIYSNTIDTWYANLHRREIYTPEYYNEHPEKHSWLEMIGYPLMKFQFMVTSRTDKDEMVNNYFGYEDSYFPNSEFYYRHVWNNVSNKCRIIHVPSITPYYPPGAPYNPELYDSEDYTPLGEYNRVQWQIPSYCNTEWCHYGTVFYAWASARVLCLR